MGLNSGEVVVGKIGDDLRMDYTAQGYTVGLGARMEQLAEPGRIYLTERTASLGSGYFDLEDLGEFDLPGASERIRVHNLRGVGRLRTRLDVSRARGFSRFVGRVGEMMTLESTLNRATEGDGQVLGVVGEAGIGKSRLCLEFVERCRAREIRVLEAHCPAHGKTVPLLPILELLRNAFGIAAQDGDQAAREKIAGRLLLLDRAFDEVLPLVFDFLGVPDPERPAPQIDPEARQRHLFAFLRQLVQARSEREPAVLLVDDLHWIDAESDAYVTQLVEAVGGTRMLLLVNFRPEYHAEWVGKSYYQQLPLTPLGPEAVGELLHALVGDDPSLADLTDLIRERTGGNPFFIEEVVQSLVESGSLEGAPGAYRLVKPVAALEVPTTVQPVLAARIDRLPEREKRVLRTASVIGRQFSEPLLVRVAELPEADLAAALSHLRSAEFIREEALYPVAEYAFKHPLTQEVALGSQLRERRARTHAAVARAIEEQQPDRLDEQAALLAHHCEEAGEELEAARWHGRAAWRAGVNSPREAQRHWGRVKALAEEVAESDETLALGLEARAQILNYASRLGIPRDEADALFREGRALARRRGDRRAEARMLLVYGMVLYLGGAPRDSLAPLEAGLALADELEDPELRYGARDCLWNAHYHLGSLDRALAYSDEGLKMVEADPHLGTELWLESGAWAYGYRALILIAMGRLEGTSRLLRRCEEIARELDEHDVLSWTEFVRSRAAHSRGDGPGALRHAGRELEHAERTGSALSLGVAWIAHGNALGLRGAWREARQSLERSVETIRASGIGLAFEPEAIASLAEACLELGEEARARVAADEAVQLARDRELRRPECEALLTRARVLAHFDGVAGRPAIEEALARSAQLLEETGARLHEPQLHLARAELADLLGDTAARARHLREAHRLYTEMGASGHAERLARELEL
jgi:adenylate cyclase